MRIQVKLGQANAWSFNWTTFLCPKTQVGEGSRSMSTSHAVDYENNQDILPHLGFSLYI